MTTERSSPRYSSRLILDLEAKRARHTTVAQLIHVSLRSGSGIDLVQRSPRVGCVTVAGNERRRVAGTRVPYLALFCSRPRAHGMWTD